MDVEEIKDKIVKKDKRKFLTFLFFLLISSLLWFLIKLSKDYTTQTSFTVVYTDSPVNKWVSTSDQQVSLSFMADGFITLRHNLVREPKRFIKVSLQDVPYRYEGGNTYSYSSQYVAELVADWLGVPAFNVTINESRQYFNMEDLQQKELPVRVPLEVKPKRQYLVYGKPKVTPASIIVYGPQSVLDTMSAIYTEVLRVIDADANIHVNLPIDYYDGTLRSAENTVQVTVQVEQFTETFVDVPVTLTDSLHVRFFPETMRVKCLVPIRDYASLSPNSFRAVADTAQLHCRQSLLDIRLEQVPENIQVVRTEPDQVEYLILN